MVKTYPPKWSNHVRSLDNECCPTSDSLCVLAPRECSNCKMYLFYILLPNVFVHHAKCICPTCQMYLSNLQNVFVQLGKCICPTYKMYLSQSTNVQLAPRPTHSVCWHQRSDERPADGDPPLLYPLLPLSTNTNTNTNTNTGRFSCFQTLLKRESVFKYEKRPNPLKIMIFFHGIWSFFLFPNTFEKGKCLETGK